MRQAARRGCLVLGLLAVCSPALAWTGEVTWPTYYRTGPGRQYQVLDEVDRGAQVEVLACQGGWCRVERQRFVGWVEQVNISPPATVPLKPTTPTSTDGCFETLQKGYGSYGEGELWRICPRPPG